MRTVLSSLFALGLFSNLAFAAPDRAVPPDIRESGFVYCVSGQVDTFNPQKAGSGLIVDTLAAQLYDRLLDVDPYTYRLVPELAESWEVLDNGATYRFRLRDDVAFQHTRGLRQPVNSTRMTWFSPSSAYSTAIIRGITLMAGTSPISTVCNSRTRSKAFANWITVRLSFA